MKNSQLFEVFHPYFSRFSWRYPSGNITGRKGLGFHHGLEFNTTKSQLICFRRSSQQEYHVSIHMNGYQLHFSDKVSHLGHILTFNLHDKDDIIRATKDLNRKANYIRASVDALCRDGTSEISRDPRTKRLQTRRESLAIPSKHTNNNF